MDTVVMHTVVMDTNRAALRGSRAGTDERGHDGARGQTESFALFTGLFSDIFTSELVMALFAQAADLYFSKVIWLNHCLS